MQSPAHVLSAKSRRQHRKVFIWCTHHSKVALGWRVDDSLSVTVSTTYRWVTTALRTKYPEWEEADSYSLFPVEVRPMGVMRYDVDRNGPPLARESQEMMIPGDYGLYTTGDSPTTSIYHLLANIDSFSFLDEAFAVLSKKLTAKARLTPTLYQQALDRDRECLFSGSIPDGSSDSAALMASWIFPPFLGYELSPEDPFLDRTYHDEPDKVDLSEFIVVENVIIGRKDIITLFWETKLASMLTDRFLRLHFQRCLAVSAGHGDVLEDYKDQEIQNFMEELGVFDDEVDFKDPRWSTPLGIEVRADLVREKMAKLADYDEDPS